MRARRIARLGLAGLLVVAASGCGIGDAGGTFTPARPGTLTVATEPLPTQGFWEGEGTHATGGLEYGMALDLADRLGLDRVAVRTLPFSAIASGDLGGADLALALITPTEQRDEVLDFTTPYIESPPAFLVRAGTEIPDVQTAQDMRIAVGAKTTFVDIVADQIRPERPAEPFEDREAELAAVLDGSVDTAMFDLPAAEAIVHADTRFAVAAKLAETEPIAAALPDGSDNTEAVGAALRAMEADGTLDRLARRWLGTSISDGFGAVPLLRTTDR